MLDEPLLAEGSASSERADVRDELRSLWKEDRRWSPTTDAKQRKDLHGGWWKAVDRTLGWVE